MHPIRGILFDKDGTLVDFNRTWLPPYRRAAAYLHACFGERAQPHELLARGGWIAETETWLPDAPLASGCNQQIIALWADIIGQPIDATVRRQIEAIFSVPAAAYVPAYGDGLARGAAAGGAQWERERERQWRAPFAELRQYDVRFGLATMDNQANAYHLLRAVGLAAWFDFVCGADSGYGVKPEVGMVAAFCAACHLQATQVMMVGDSPCDMRMGKNAGVALTVGVLSGAHDAAALAPEADLVVASIADLSAVMRKKAGASLT